MRDAASQSKRRPSFSLRTLILTICQLGCGYALWREWAPWQTVFRFDQQDHDHASPFTPDGSHIWIKADDDEVQVWNLDDRRRVAAGKAGEYAVGQWTADGRKLLIDGDVSSLIFDLDADAEPATRSGGGRRQAKGARPSRRVPVETKIR
jgi:hypothetical protein